MSDSAASVERERDPQPGTDPNARNSFAAINRIINHPMVVGASALLTAIGVWWCIVGDLGLYDLPLSEIAYILAAPCVHAAVVRVPWLRCIGSRS